MKNLIITCIIIIVSILISCTKKKNIPASVIYFDGVEHVYNDLVSFEAGRSPVSYVEWPLYALWADDPASLKFSLSFKNGSMLTNNNIHLVSYAREGMNEATLMFRRNDTSFLMREEAFIQGSYSNGIVKYTIDSLRFIAFHFDYINPAIRTTDTILVTGTIYASSDR